tara:strand:+ start:222 stop:1022 length:801 start_codon:yes stop_codon:yes gene_type:complete
MKNSYTSEMRDSCRKAARADFLNIGANAKTVKNTKVGYLTGILYLAPEKLSGRNVCSHATPGCIASCLNTAGQGRYDNVQAARIAKTKLFYASREEFWLHLERSLEFLTKKAAKLGHKPSVRLNGTSDLPFESFIVRDGRTIMELWPDVEFYDYTKVPKRMRKYLSGAMPANYSLTFSYTENNAAACSEFLADGGTVAVVFEKELPAFFMGFPVVNGDEHDAINTRDGGTILGLSAKGRAKQDTTGFVVRASVPVAFCGILDFIAA